MHIIGIELLDDKKDIFKNLKHNNTNFNWYSFCGYDSCEKMLKPFFYTCLSLFFPLKKPFLSGKIKVLWLRIFRSFWALLTIFPWKVTEKLDVSFLRTV